MVASKLTYENGLSSKCAIHWLPQCTDPIALDYSLQVHTIVASNWISKLTELRTPTLLKQSLHMYLHTCSIRAPKCSMNLAPLWSPTVPPNSHHDSLQEHPQSHLITISECIYKFIWLRAPGVSQNTLDYPHLVHLQPRSVTASECVSQFTHLSFSGPPRIVLNQRLQPVPTYHVGMCI